MTPAIDTLPPRELDVLIAEKVFGYAVLPRSRSESDYDMISNDESRCKETVPHYSTDPAACDALIEKMLELEMPVSISSYTKGKRFRVVFGKGFQLQGKESFEDSLPLAVARAAAKAITA